ncbi:hypothetical protein LOK49_LG07G02073 [Camellia lanceoleosa]|uniref:Uncharacterized protein n=1 Tax=Camellia lanceoleosa TaxID=1840588 RepID=A0ACC0GZV4_9ERIC|nr:hypothetical protein LOK49_LG07G02073 [Camellia lanceoleosa]
MSTLTPTTRPQPIISPTQEAKEDEATSHRQEIQNLKPIPCSPSKTLHFDKHEHLLFLRRFGLWDFSSTSSSIPTFAITVNQAALALARAFKLPVKKDKSNASALSSEVVNLNSEALRAIKEGRCKKVGWAGFIWIMVEKELLQGKQLEDCYFASYLQYLIKLQREEVSLEELKEDYVENPKVVAEVMLEEGGGEPKLVAEVELKEEKGGEEPKVEAELELKEKDGGEEPKVVVEVVEGSEKPKVVAEVEFKEEEGGEECKVKVE